MYIRGTTWVERVRQGVAVYYGMAQTVLDEKGRITVPRRYREVMNVLGHTQWFMNRGFDGSIFLFPRQEWDKIRSQASAYSSMDTRALDFRRMFFGSVSEATPDRQGRMAVPAHLREYANLEREGVLLGVDDHLELWSREGWRAFQDGKDGEYKQMAAELFVPSDAPTLGENQSSPV